MTTPALADYRTRVENQLVDTSLVVFTSDTIDEALRQALGDVNLAMGGSYTIKDLDGAAGTTLPAELGTVLVQGAAGYAVQAQVVRKLGAFSMIGTDPQQHIPADYQIWAKNKLYYFKQLLEQYQRKSFFSSTSAPYSALAWDEENGDAADGSDDDD